MGSHGPGASSAKNTPPANAGRGRCFDRLPRGWPTGVGVAALLLFVALPLVGEPIRGHDTALHFFRMPSLDALWRQGVFFSRWMPELGLGYGYPLFSFYPPLGVYLMTALYRLLGDARWAYSLALIMALVLTVGGMVLLGHDLYGRLGGLLSAAAYALAPHLLYQTYQRGSISNALALAFYPWAMLGMLRVARGRGIGWVLCTALAVAAVFLSHISAAVLYMVPMCLVALLAARLYRPPGARWRSVLAVGIAIAIGAGLAAFSWLPALAELPFTRYAVAVAQEDEAYHQHFADVWRLAPLPIAELANPDLVQTPGAGQMVVACTAVVVALSALWARSRRNGVWTLTRRRTAVPPPAPSCCQPPRWDSPSATGRATDAITLALGAIALGAVLLATPASRALWDRVAPLRNFQYPWRWLDLAVFPLALVCGRLGRLTTGTRHLEQAKSVTSGDGPGTSRRSWLHSGLVCLCMAVFLMTSLPYVYPPRWRGLPAKPDLADVQRAELELGIYGLTSWGEYMPASVPEQPRVAQPGIEGLGRALDRKLLTGELPPGAILSSAGGPTWAELQLRLPRTTDLVFDVHYFPGWSVSCDGSPLAARHDDYGRLTMPVPAGEHEVRVGFGSTQVRVFADALSWTSVALVGTMLAVLPWRHFGRRRSDARGGRPNGERATAPPSDGHDVHSGPPAILGAAVILLALAVKTVWFDRVDSCVVRHVYDGRIVGLASSASRDWGDMLLVAHRLESPSQLALYWQAQYAPMHDYAVELTLTDARGVPWRVITHTHPGHNLTSRWEPGQLVRDEYVLPIGDSPRPALYRLSVGLVELGWTAPHSGEPILGEALSLRDGSQGQRTTAVGELAVPPGRTHVSSAAKAVRATFGERIALEGVDLPTRVAAGTPVQYCLYWHALRTVGEDYTVFVHLLSAGGQVLADNDGQPYGGLYPTSAWQPGERMAEPRTWALDVPPGEYTVEVGLYLLSSGERVPAKADRQAAADHVVAGRIQIVS